MLTHIGRARVTFVPKYPQYDMLISSCQLTISSGFMLMDTNQLLSPLLDGICDTASLPRDVFHQTVDYVREVCRL